MEVSQMVQYYDVIYYGLAGGIFLALVYSVVTGNRIRVARSTTTIEERASGVVLLGLGTAIALLGGLLTDLLLKRSSLFQQARYALFYTGFAIITLGFTLIVKASDETPSRPNYLPDSGLLIRAIWTLFVGSLVVSTFYLISPATYVFNQYGVQVQLVVYSIPLLVSSLAGATILFLIAFAGGDSGARPFLLWIGAYAALVFAGLLRESLVLPELGNPLANLLIVFIPFFCGCSCLSIGVRSLARSSDLDQVCA
jgi:MFS family permease